MQNSATFSSKRVLHSFFFQFRTFWDFKPMKSFGNFNEKALKTTKIWKFRIFRHFESFGFNWVNLMKFFITIFFISWPKPSKTTNSSIVQPFWYSYQRSLAKIRQKWKILWEENLGFCVIFGVKFKYKVNKFIRLKKRYLCLHWAHWAI